MSQLAVDAKRIHEAIATMALRLMDRPGDGPFAVVGIRRGGEELGRRLQAILSERTQRQVPLGSVDITLYRDDGFGPHDWPEVGPSAIDFSLQDHTVVLVDDVLYTGRTVRAALDAILDYGRPRAVRLAVLVDRGLRELPIRPDAVGFFLEMRPDEHVDVSLNHDDPATDAVRVRRAKQRSEHAQ